MKAPLQQSRLARKGGNGNQSFFPCSTIFPKLTINAPNDKYEQEADAMAERVMSMPDGTARVQRACAQCEQEEGLQRQESEEEEAPLQMKSLDHGEHVLQTESSIRPDGNGGMMAGPDLQRRLDGSKGAGNALPDSTRLEMGQAFGTDFSNVRIHTDSRAHGMNLGIQAKAFTHGSDIYFRQGEYNPRSAPGKKLLAHELTHVVQQGASRVQPKRELSRQLTSDQIFRQVGSESGRNIRYRCTQLGCPVLEHYAGMPCHIHNCGRGSCRHYLCRLLGLENILIRAWCVYGCPNGGALIVFYSSFGNFKIGPFYVP